MWHVNRRTRRALRRFTLGSGPLKRRSDRLEFGGRVVLIVLLLMAVPLSVLAALTSATGMRARATAQAVDRHSVTGTLLATAHGPSDTEGSAVLRAPVAYRVTGGPREGLALVPAGTREGTRVELWVDRKGNLTAPPRDPGQVTAQAIGIGLVAFCGLSTGAVLAYLTFRFVLDRSRIRRWAAGWAAVEPRWSGKVR